MPDKPKDKPEQQYAVTTATTTADGVTTSTTKTPIPTADTSDADERNKAYFRAMAKFSNDLMDTYPDLRDLVRRAVRGEWTDQEFWDEYNKTPFAIERTKAQELFDTEILGQNADTWQKKISDTAEALRQRASAAGLTLTPQEIDAQARSIVRSDLSDVVQTQWVAQKWQDTGKPTTGTAGLIQDQLRNLARSYGQRLSQQRLDTLTGQALGQGQNWQQWVAGQEDVFRQDAINLYPTAGGALATRRLSEIANPYLQDAAELLGLTEDQMDVTDPKWMGFLSGQNGMMTRDEWMRTLKTDSRYGYDRSTTARREMAALGDELLSAFAKA